VLQESIGHWCSQMVTYPSACQTECCLTFSGVGQAAWKVAEEPLLLRVGCGWNRKESGEWCITGGRGVVVHCRGGRSPVGVVVTVPCSNREDRGSAYLWNISSTAHICMWKGPSYINSEPPWLPKVSNETIFFATHSQLTFFSTNNEKIMFENEFEVLAMMFAC
jgi:hypothetical protein